MTYLDSNVVIRLIEGVDSSRLPIIARLAPLMAVPKSMMTSELARMECRVLPLRLGDTNTLKQFDLFLLGLEMDLISVSRDVLEKAAEIRATYNFKTPDAIHYATAILAGATTFLTGDKQLARAMEVPVEVL